MSSNRTRLLSVAGGTLVSRLSGLLRILVLAYVLGFSAMADSYNLANTIPNMLFDLILGGIAGATFIPVFVERLALDGERRAWRSISSVLTASVTLLFAATVLVWLVAPQVVQAFTFVHPAHGDAAATAVQRGMATTFLRWFTPQIFLYGFIGIATALLNIRRVFAAPAWAPIANNIVCVAVLWWFHSTSGHSVHSMQSHLNGLAAGTTLGVLIQALILLPSLWRADLGRLRWRWHFREPVVTHIARLGSWSVGIVMANQLSLYVILAMAFGLGGVGPISAYTYGWAFMQMPYAVIVVSVLNVMSPELAALAAAHETEAFTARLTRGLSRSLTVIVPLTVFFVVMAQPIVAIFLHHADARHPLRVGVALAVLAAGLPGFTLFQISIRALQSLQLAREAFWLYFVENLLTVVIAVLIGQHSFSGLMASISLAYTLAAIVAMAVLHEKGIYLLPSLRERDFRITAAWSLVGAMIMALVYNLYNWTTGLGLFARTVVAGGTGVGVVLVGRFWILGRDARAARQVRD